MRNVHINYDENSGMYMIALMVNHEVKEKRETPNYHDISGIVSNWIHNGY